MASTLAEGQGDSELSEFPCPSARIYSHAQARKKIEAEAISANTTGTCYRTTLPIRLIEGYVDATRQDRSVQTTVTQTGGSMKRASIPDILWLFLGTRIILLVGTYFSYILFPVPPHIYPETPVNITGLLTSWGQWDALRFIHIAQYGYQSASDTPFFPLFPLLIKGIALLCGNRGYLAIGMLISNGALLGTLVLLYQLAADALGEKVGKRTLLYICIFPTAFFFFAAYNESLFLFLSCGTFLALRRRKWWLAGVLGALTALTRSAGVLMALPFLYEVWIDRSLPAATEAQHRFWQRIWESVPKALPVLLLPLGTLLYCFFCWIHFDNPLAFAAVQSQWGRATAWPWMGLASAFTELFYNQPFGSFIEAHILLDLTATISFIILAVYSWRQLRPGYALWISLLVIYMLISPALNQHDALQSIQRFVLEMFPGFIVLAVLGLKHPRLHTICILTFPFLQAIMAALFVLGRWMV